MSIDVEKIRRDTGRAIRLARVERDLQQQELAKMAGMRANHLGKLERGELPIRVEHVVAVAQALKCSPTDLIPKEKF